MLTARLDNLYKETQSAVPQLETNLVFGGKPNLAPNVFGVSGTALAKKIKTCTV